jgi:ubiquinone/menaquinone biosynthesis C-methylase UbiE
VQQAFFDTYAQTYDDHFTNSMIGKAQRKQVYKHALNNAYFFNKRVLEVNCGTGEDALWLVKQGANVLATDISESMLEVANAKTGDKDIQWKQMPAQDIAQLAPDTFGTIFSNFGGLNCLSPAEMEQFKNGCVKVQAYEDQLVMVLMARKCIWERFYYSYIQKDPSKAKRRSAKDGAEAVIEGKSARVYYYGPKEIKRLFKKEYRHVNTKPIGLFVPPSYMEDAFRKRKILFTLLVLLDKVFGNFSFLSDHADHYIIFFEKRT